MFSKSGLIDEIRARFAHVDNCPFQGDRVFFENAGDVVDEKTGLPMRKKHFGGMRDYSKRDSSCYDAVMCALVQREAQALGLKLPFKKYDYEKLLVDNYWAGSYFKDDLSTDALTADANIYPFWLGIITDKKLLEKIKPLKWYDDNNKIIPETIIDFSQEFNWFTEAQLSSPFLRGENKEGYTNADAVFGDYWIDKKARILLSNNGLKSSTFSIIEAKTNSELSKGTKNDDFFRALQHLKHNKHKVVLFHVIDQKTELNFDFDTAPRKFIDLESGDEITIFADSVKEAYESQVSIYFKKIALTCAQNKIKYVPVSVGANFEKILITYLVEKQTFG